MTRVDTVIRLTAAVVETTANVIQPIPAHRNPATVPLLAAATAGAVATRVAVKRSTRSQRRSLVIKLVGTVPVPHSTKAPANRKAAPTSTTQPFTDKSAGSQTDTIW